MSQILGRIWDKMECIKEPGQLSGKQGLPESLVEQGVGGHFEGEFRVNFWLQQMHKQQRKCWIYAKANYPATKLQTAKHLHYLGPLTFSRNLQSRRGILHKDSLPIVRRVQPLQIRAAFADAFFPGTGVDGFHHSGIGVPHQVSYLGTG